MKPLVGVIMGSRSDWSTMTHAAETLSALGVPFEVRVVSAHRTPDLLYEYADEAVGRGLEVLIAGAGGAAHLPGMTAAQYSAQVAASDGHSHGGGETDVGGGDPHAGHDVSNAERSSFEPVDDPMATPSGEEHSDDGHDH